MTEGWKRTPEKARKWKRDKNLVRPGVDGRPDKKGRRVYSSGSENWMKAAGSEGI